MYVHRNHPFKTSANFSQFLTPTPLPSAVFLLLSVGKFGKFLTPPPLKNADVLNGWSLTYFFDNYSMITALIQLKSVVKLSNNLQKYISEMDLNVICTFVEKKSIWLANVALTNLISKMPMKWIVMFVMKITNYFLNHCFRWSQLLFRSNSRFQSEFFQKCWWSGLWCLWWR